jgi:hypothetical protein
MLALIFRPFRGKVIYHDHSTREIKDLKGAKRIVLQQFLRRTDECIFVGEHILSDYVGYRLPRDVRIEPAFLPPPLDEEPLIWKTYSEETLQFINSHSPLVVANAFRIAFYQGTDIYGLDMCVNLIQELITIYPKIGLLFALAEVGEEEYFRVINQKIEKLGIHDNIYFMKESFGLSSARQIYLYVLLLLTAMGSVLQRQNI